jgi:hypothetical protein
MTATGVRKALQKFDDLSEGPDVIGDSGSQGKARTML